MSPAEQKASADAVEHGRHGDVTICRTENAAATEGASLLGLSLLPRCFLGRLVSFQAVGVPLRHIPPPHYRNVDNR